jgi:hypothetical protein
VCIVVFKESKVYYMQKLRCIPLLPRCHIRVYVVVCIPYNNVSVFFFRKMLDVFLLIWYSKFLPLQSGPLPTSYPGPWNSDWRFTGATLLGVIGTVILSFLRTIVFDFEIFSRTPSPPFLAYIKNKKIFLFCSLYNYIWV